MEHILYLVNICRRRFSLVAAKECTVLGWSSDILRGLVKRNMQPPAQHLKYGSISVPSSDGSKQSRVHYGLTRFKILIDLHKSCISQFPVLEYTT
jgi:hypothetical protein